MAKKASKFFRIGVEGDTCDGRVISAQDIQEMAETFDPRVYGCRINLEHLRGILPDGIFKRYGDVVELKAEKIDDDSALKGKWALFAKITPTDDLIAMNKAAQKVYTSMEIQPNFANTGKCYLVGLAVTDDPVSALKSPFVSGSLPGIGQRLTFGQTLGTITGVGAGRTLVQPAHSIRQASAVPAAKIFVFIQ